MRKAGMDTRPRDRPHVIDIEEDFRIDKNEGNIKGRLRDRSKCAEDLRIDTNEGNIKDRLRNRSKRTEDYRSSKESQSICLTEDILGTEHLDDLAFWNGKIILPQNGTVKRITLRRNSAENLNALVQVTLHKPKRHQNTNTSSESKRRALSKNAANSWEIKYNPILKAKALKDDKNLRVCLKDIAPCDRNAKVVSVRDKLKRSGINNPKQKTEDKVVSSINLGADSKQGFSGSNTFVASNNNKDDPCESFNTFKDRKNNECTGFEYFARRLKRVSTTIALVPKRVDTPRNGAPNAQISNTSADRNVKEKSTVLEIDEKQDLLLKKEAKDRDSILETNEKQDLLLKKEAKDRDSVLETNEKQDLLLKKEAKDRDSVLETNEKQDLLLKKEAKDRDSVLETNEKQDLLLKKEAKDRDSVLETNEKQDLLLKTEAEDRDSVLNRIPCENVGKTRKMPIVTETTVLFKNTIRISNDVQGTDLLGPNILLKSSPEFDISKCKSHNTYTKINKAELLNLGDANVFKNSNEKTADNLVVEVKNSVKKNRASAKANNYKKDSSTVKTTACKDTFSTKVSDELYNVKFSSEYSSIRDNKTNVLPAQVLPPRDRTTDTTVNTNKCLNNVSAATRMNTESSSSSNNALKRRAENGVVARQKIVRTKEETEKISTKAEDLYKKVNLSNNKCANSSQSIGNDGPKRIKLDRSVCFKNLDRKRENNDVCNNTGGVIASSTAGTVPQIVIAGSSKPTIVAHAPETKSKNEEDILNLVEEKACTSFGSTNKEDSVSPQNVWKPSEVTSETPKSPAQHKFVVEGKINCDSETVMDDEDTDTDCISLHADAKLLEEYDSPVISAQPNSRKSLVHCEKPYAMTDHVFNNYYESTASEFNKAYETINANNSQNTTAKADRMPVALRLGMPFSKEVAPANPQNPHNYGTTKVARRMIPKYFHGYCYTYIRTGNCSMEACKFRHNFLTLIIKLYTDGDRYLFEMIDNLVLMGFLSFLTNMYEQLVRLHYEDTIFVLKVLKRVYELTVATDNIAEWTFLVWKRTNTPMEMVVNNLARIVDHNDSNFVNWILKLLQNHIVHHRINGTYWNTLKALLLKVPNLEPEIITIIVRECVTTRKNVDDVHRNIVIKLNNKVRSAVDQRLWLRFNNLLKCTRENNAIKESLSSQSDIYIRSLDVQNPVHETESALTTSQHSVTIPRKVWTEISPKIKERDDNNNAQNGSPVLQPIDDLPEPNSPHDRRIFCKFYLDVQSLQKGLKDDDYDHVTRILNAAKPTDKTVFSRECYKILCKEVKCSQSRLSKLISFAVQIGATPLLYEILLDVAIHILARLAKMELWVLALKLLEDVDIMIKMRIRLQEIDAVNLLLLAEIYLANDEPMKAFTLLKQTNVISTNRNKWETPSNAKDDRIRAQVVALLLDRLCEMSPHHAIFLLEFLVDDQPSNFSPVDLARSVNKIVPVVLLEGDHESIINIAKLIDKYNFTLNTITHRALTAALVHIDKHLAMQFYQRAIGLGVYSNVRFHPATYVIIHSDWTNEEIYLVILDLMQQLSSNIGHAIDRISLQTLSIHVHFETIPSETQLACDRGADEQNDKRIIETKKRMAAVLEKQFEPPILLAKSRNGKLCRLQNTSVRRYLQCEHPR